MAIIFFGADFESSAQQRNVQGRVINESADGIPGVNVVIKGTTIGTVTNAEGNYTIAISGAGDVLAFSFVGYASVEKQVGPHTVLNVQMNPDLTELSEVVVTGYSSIQRKDISSSIAVVDVEDMKKYSSSNFAEQLQGKVPGVQITTTSDPGSAQSIRIRGIGSVNNNEPLYVVDGVPIQNEANMNFLNPNDIASIQVLKDAASASIYGSRAANGVIVITTRKGKGQPKLNIDFYKGIQEITKTIQGANPSEVLEIEKGLAEGAGLPFTNTLYIEDDEGNWALPDHYVFTNGYRKGDPAVDPSKYFLNTAPTGDYSNNYPITKANKDGTDWFEEMFRPATITNLQVAASGGGEKTNFYFSANYFDHEGIMIRNFYQRFQVRMNATYHIGDKVRIGENANIAYEARNGGLGGGNYINFSYSPSIRDIIYENQLVPVYDINGYWASNNVMARQNRIADGAKGHTLRLTGNIFGEIDLLKNFTYKTNFGLDYGTGPKEDYSYTCPECTPQGRNFPNSLKVTSFYNFAWVWSNTLSFNKSINSHSFSLLAGLESRRAYFESSEAVGSRLTYGDDPKYRVLSNTDPSTYNINSFKTDHTMSSVFFNANYNFKDKYLLTATVRQDGSSRFINNKYGTFPAASVGWRISNEPFMSSVGILTDLKLRASYGTTGNNEVLGGNYPGYTSYTTDKSASSYDILGTGNRIVAGFAQNSAGNPDLKWETSILTDIGMDITLWKQIDLTIDWFQRETKDMIYPVRLPLQSGGFYQNQNIGSMMNKGFEVLLTFRGTALKKNLNYTISLAGTHYNNKVLALDADGNTFVDAAFSRIGPITRTEAGYPISQFRGYIVDGLWQSQEQIDSVLFSDPGPAKPGRMKFEDLNEDGKIDDSDMTYIGSPIPKLSLGLTFSLTYKNFDFTTYISGVYGRKVFDYGYYLTDFNSPFRGNPSKRMLYDAGKSLPVLDLRDGYSSARSTYYVDDASYTRLRNVVLGYTFSKKLSSKIGLQTARIYIQGQNLFTWTSYHGLDPEGSVINVRNGNEAQRDYVIGVDNYDWGRYPPARQIIIGVNCEF